MIFIINLKINDLDLLVDVILKRSNRRLYIRPKKPNIIKITTPIKLTESKIKEYLISNYEFIKKALSCTPLNINPNVLHLFGKAYNLKLIQDIKPRTEILDDTIYIYAKNLEQRTIQRTIDLFYTLELSNIVENNIEEIKNKFKLYFKIDFEYKNVKTYFGECFPKKRKVILATKLAKYDKDLILSVIYHELAHFYYMNHGSGFYTLLETVFPNYRVFQRKLRKIRFTDIY